jgi:hypothetical protein
MTSYLVLSLAYCNTFEGMPPRGNVNFEEDLAQFWYPTLWKHKAPFYFYEIQDSFVKECKSILIRTDLARVIEAAMDFLRGKGVCVFEEKFTYIRLFNFKGKPLLLPQFVCDRFFVYELCRQYRTLSLLFDKKRKKKFIPCPSRFAIL